MDFKTFLLVENKQEIISLGFPKVIADILYENFGKSAFQVAKWNKDYSSYKDKDNWWYVQNTSYSLRTISIGDYVRLYESSYNLETYKDMYNKIYELDTNIKDYELEEQRNKLKQRISEDLLNSTFFSHYSLINDIKNGKLLDLSPYKKLSFNEAQDKYDKKNIFKDIKPLKIYENGWKWINVGKKCHLLGKLMKNCGSAGVMGSDPDRSIIALFDKGNKPHVVVTYSPNEKKISGDEGIGSSMVKDKYSDYVLDLVNFLGVKFEEHKTKNKLLKLKNILSNDLVQIERLKSDGYDEFFNIKLKNNIEYISDGYFMISKEDLEKIKQRYNINYQKALNFKTRPKIDFENKDINYIKLSN